MKIYGRRSITVLSVLILSLSISQSAIARSQAAQSSNGQSHTLPIEDVQRFSTAIGQIKKYYVEPVSDQQLFENAIRGMLSGLDPHSSYLDIEEFNDLRSHTNGEFGGLGIEVGMEDGYIRVISPIDDTPAAKAGIKAGDLIIRIDGKPVKGMNLREAVSLMRGKKGSAINLTIYRKGENKPLQFKVTRDVIHIKSVKSRMLDDGYGYVRVSHFQQPTSQALKKAIDNLIKENHGKKLKGLVLDLRNNPGGLLDSAIDVSDVFLDSRQLGKDNIIVFTKGRIPGAQFEARATPGDKTKGTPIVVLVNGGSASGSEIVAGALQDHKRAVIMGTETFGKGSVQTVLPLGEKRGVKLTTALYYTPHARSIQAKGIKPDVVIEHMDFKTDKDAKDIQLTIYKEADLDNHLANGNGQAESNSQNGKKPQNSNELAGKDYQLHEALNLLKGLHVANR